MLTHKTITHAVTPATPSLLLAVSLIKRFEGCSLKTYLCPAGIPTIGYGHVILSHESFKTPLSTIDAHLLLLDDIAKFYPHVRKLTPNNLDCNQVAALVSFAFNVGISAFRASTLRRKLIRKDDIFSTANEFDRWVYAKGQKLRGLVIRRREEKAVFLTSTIR